MKIVFRNIDTICWNKTHVNIDNENRLLLSFYKCSSGIQSNSYRESVYDMLGYRILYEKSGQLTVFKCNNRHCLEFSFYLRNDIAYKLRGLILNNID